MITHLLVESIPLWTAHRVHGPGLPVALQDLGFPPPKPEPPPGGQRILGVVNNFMWGAGVALLIGLFSGLIVWVGGRWVDHHRAGKIGVVMMLTAVGGAIVWGIAWTLINGFAGTK
ncbi:hypothetical protein [Sciscionella marina]|uniref:hypothetical protein n=1 Tax=Sciscionella marina TaxID=508770 RepID=UPI001F09021F|nr:hypothetical protein [Sciscionella marina]